MSEWWPLLAVFWLLYLADGWRATRRARVHVAGLRSARGPATASPVFCVVPSPTAWALSADDLPASLGPSGLTNWPSASALRPPPLPDTVATWDWEQVRDVRARGGWIWINGRRFTPETAAMTAATLEELARRLAPLDGSARAAALTRWQQQRLRVMRLRRRQRVVLARSRGLALLNAGQTLAVLAASLYLGLGGAAHAPPAVRDAVARAAPVLLGLLGLAHLFAVSWFHRLHRRFHPGDRQTRNGLTFTALLVPAQALRLRLHLMQPLAANAHPAALALATATPDAARRLLETTWRDLRWPLRPDSLPTAAAAAANDAGALIEPLLSPMLVAAGVPIDPASLLAAPSRESLQACAYCPRCRDQFIVPPARCPHGVPLMTWDTRKPTPPASTPLGRL